MKGIQRRSTCSTDTSLFVSILIKVFDGLYIVTHSDDRRQDRDITDDDITVDTVTYAIRPL